MRHYSNIKKITFFISLFFLGLSLSAIPCTFAQGSIIDAVQKSQVSIVTVIAETTGMFRSPKKSAAIDKKTGRIVLLNRVKTAYYKRSGAGVIINAHGLIATNAHTVDNAGRVTIKLSDGTKVPGKVVYIKPEQDFAIIQIIPPYPLKSIILSDSDKIKLGDEVVTVGNSELLKQTISGGKVIGLGTNHSKKVLGDKNTNLVQTDIALYKGDSGGPLLNKKGELIGIMVAGQIQGKRSSFAIVSNRIKLLYAQYLMILRKEKEKR